MKINKKLSAAITLSLMLGLCGSVSAAESLHGSSSDAAHRVTDTTKVDGNATTEKNEALSTGAAYNIKAGEWYFVYGGYSEQGSATGNEVTIEAGSTINGAVMGGYVLGEEKEPGTVTSNKVVVNGGNFYSSVVGGGVNYGDAGDADDKTKGNSVNVDGGTITNVGGDGKDICKIVGGWSMYGGNAYNNSAYITGGELNDVFGGLANNGEAKNNNVNVGGNIDYSITDVISINNVYGGKAGNPAYTANEAYDVIGNSVAIDYVRYNGDIARTPYIKENVYGGHTEKGTAGENEVEISNGNIFGNVYGGYTKDGAASSNQVSFSNDTIGYDGKGGLIYGGYTEAGAAEHNTVTVESGTIGSYSIVIDGLTTASAGVYGGYSVDGAVTQNTVTINGGTIGVAIGGAITGGIFVGDVSGGRTVAGNATQNTVTITDGTIHSFVLGGYTGAGDAKSNYVTITGGKVTENVYGGRSAGTGKAEANTVEITSSASTGIATEIQGEVYGGSAWDAGQAADNNTVLINGTSDKGIKIGIMSASEFSRRDVYGGLSYAGVAAGNKVGTTDNLANYFSAGAIYGGRGVNGATNNEVNLGVDAVVQRAYGGYSNNGSVETNKVTINGADVLDNIYGGISEKSTATGNEVTMISGNARCYVYGGQGETGADSNKVIVKGGTLHKDIYGGQSIAGSSESNSVTIASKSAVVKGDVYGGQGETNAISNEVILGAGTSVTGYIYGGKAISGVAEGNKIGTKANPVANFSGASLYGGRGETGAAGNEVNLGAGTKLTGSVRGGCSSSGVVENNIVRINGGSTKAEIDSFVYGADTTSGTAVGNQVGTLDEAATNFTAEYVYGGRGASTASENKIYLGEGVAVSEEAYGGRADGTAEKNSALVKDTAEIKDLYGGRGITAANENEVTILGGTITGAVYGGMAVNTANDNIVNLGLYKDGKAEGIAKVTGIVYGGKAASSAGNTLNVYSVGNQVGGLESFQNMNFYIPATANVGDILVDASAAVDLSGVDVKAGFHNDTALSYGDKVKLINAPAVSGFDGVSTAKVAESDFTEVDLRVYQGDGSMNQVASGATTLVAEIYNKELTENAKSVVETVVTGTTIISEGSEMLSFAGFESAESAIAAEGGSSGGSSSNGGSSSGDGKAGLGSDVEKKAPGGSMSVFGAIGGNKSKVKSGSHVDVKGWNMNLGLAKQLKNKSGKLMFAPVVEYGRGDYDSYLNNGYHGEGDTHFVGGGLMAKQTNNSGVYYEGSLRAGKLMAKYKSTGGSYDSDSTYIAAHLGLGKVVKLSSKDKLDYYGKYYYSHQGSDDTTIKTSGKPLGLHFDGVDSHRTRLGGRLSHVLGGKNSVYVGFAWQHEFNSNARAILDGIGTPSPSVKGDTGIMELGWKVSETNKYDVDLGATGSIGKKKGTGLNLNFNWKF